MPPETTLYTGVGDDGYTGVLGRERVAKYDLQPVAYGTLDELSAALGLARTGVRHPCSNDIIVEVQRDLYRAMADLATTPEAAQKTGAWLAGERVVWLEGIIDEVGSEVEIPPAFIVSGDSYAGALLDIARTICRRAERHVAKLHHQAMLSNIEALRYLNRLSSLLFAMSRLEDKAAGVEEFTLARLEKR
ncbi:MAG: cob(I)yrinic acid a,c-diamide adenosyltransferase [Caldilineales bacterium]